MKIAFKWPLLFVVALVGVVLAGAIVFSRNSISNRAVIANSYTLQDVVDGKLTVSILRLSAIEPASSSADQMHPGLPVHLSIPKINVDASVESVGLTPDGAMDVPKNQEDVAWFNLGQRPGEIGTAVIVGHYGWKDGKPSAFDDLHNLRQGDVVSIEDDAGASTSFVVREIRRYDPKADASAVFVSTDGKSHLNLVTCEGVWNTATEGYTKRLVVFTDREQ